MDLEELFWKALKYGIPLVVLLLMGAWLWVTFARIATGPGPRRYSHHERAGQPVRATCTPNHHPRKEPA
jgi:hypothetical protein